MNLKQEIYNQYQNLITDNIQMLKHSLIELQESINLETKSSAGDKFETARTMLHIEQENMNKRLMELREQLANFERIKTDPITDLIRNGSLVETNMGIFYLSAALGKILLDGKTIFALSPQSPLGLRLMGLSINDQTEINGIKYIIENIS